MYRYLAFGLPDHETRQVVGPATAGMRKEGGENGTTTWKPEYRTILPSPIWADPGGRLAGLCPVVAMAGNERWQELLRRAYRQRASGFVFVLSPVGSGLFLSRRRPQDQPSRPAGLPRRTTYRISI